MTRESEKLVFPSGLSVPCLGLRVMFCEDWVFFPDCVNISGLPSGLSWLTPSLYPFHGEMKKAGMRFTDRVVHCSASLILVPPSAIYLIPLGLIFHSIILNKITIKPSWFICASVPLCSQHKVRAKHRSCQLCLRYFGAKSGRKVPSHLLFVASHINIY